MFFFRLFFFYDSFVVIVLFSLGIFLSSMAVKVSFYFTVATYGLLFGIGVGLAYAPPLACAMKVFYFISHVSEFKLSCQTNIQLTCLTSLFRF